MYSIKAFFDLKPIKNLYHFPSIQKLLNLIKLVAENIHFYCELKTLKPFAK